MSTENSEPDLIALKEAVCAQQKLLQKLYNELDVEREASATAASEALSMILRLQGEKAAVKMEACQYKRMAEEKMFHVEESLAVFEDLMNQKEFEIASLDYQVEAYRHKLFSLGYNDVSVSEFKIPENVNESLDGNMDAQSSMRTNSMPALPYKFSYPRKFGSGERSPSPDFIPKVVEEDTNQELQTQSSGLEKKMENSAPGDFNSYWEQIKKLDERMREITDQKGIRPAKVGPRTRSLAPEERKIIMSDPEKGVIKSKSIEKQLNNLRIKLARADSASSAGVLDVFEVPETQERDHEQQGRDQNKFNSEGGERVRELEFLRKEVFGTDVKDENDQILKLHKSSHLHQKIRKLKDGVPVECHLARVQPLAGIAEFQAKFQQLNRRSEIVEVGRESQRGEEEVKLLKEIQEQLNSIQSQITSLKTVKSSPPDVPLDPLAEAMLYFWF